MESLEIFERGIAVLGALLVGGTALVQLRNELTVPGLDAQVTKLLLGLMVIGCVLALLGAVKVMGVFA